jgi:hypothetical protein
MSAFSDELNKKELALLTGYLRRFIPYSQIPEDAAVVLKDVFQLINSLPDYSNDLAKLDENIPIPVKVQ